jgi:NIPSNAP protein
MIVEVRTYRTKPGCRAEFVRLFEERTGPSQTSLGMTLIGPLLDVEDPDVVIWLRGFPSMEERERMKEAFYEGAAWKTELEGLVMPLLQSYSAVACQASPRMFDGPLNAARS